MKRERAEEIVRETENGYNLIADKFSETRKFFWRDLEFIKNYIADGDKVLDFGCGNGRLLELLKKKDIEYYGTDVSAELLKIAKQRYQKEKYHFEKITGLGSIPFQDGFFNKVFAIAVFHHIPGNALRLEAAKELYRVMKPGGFMIVTVWNLWRLKYFKNIIKGWAHNILGTRKIKLNDCYIKFKDNDGKIFNRYHHAFYSAELRNLLETVGFKINEVKVYKSRNIIAVCRKE